MRATAFSRRLILILSAFSVSLAAQGQEAQTVTVQLVDDSFVPDKLTFRSGVPYVLRLENRGNEMHEFTAPQFLKTVEVQNPDVLEQAGNEVLVQPGATKELRFVARKPGRYALICADHEWDHMVGEITVE